MEYAGCQAKTGILRLSWWNQGNKRNFQVAGSIKQFAAVHSTLLYVSDTTFPAVDRYAGKSENKQ